MGFHSALASMWRLNTTLMEACVQQLTYHQLPYNKTLLGPRLDSSHPYREANSRGCWTPCHTKTPGLLRNCN